MQFLKIERLAEYEKTPICWVDYLFMQKSPHKLVALSLIVDLNTPFDLNSFCPNCFLL